MKTKWLHTICTERAEITMYPHSVEVDGEQWTMATDGYIVVALRAQTAGLQAFPREGPKEWLRARADGDVLNFAELRTWVNPDKPNPCPFCGGSGHASDVDYGDGMPEEFADDPDEALLCGFPLNLWLLRKPFKYVEAETVRVSHLKEHRLENQPKVKGDRGNNYTGDCYPMLIDGRDWRIVIMGMRVSLSDLDNLPKFPA